MNLYDIDSEIMGLIDPDTGELLPDAVERMAELQMKRMDKLESIACLIKNLRSDASALAAEIKSLTERKRQAERTDARLVALLSEALGGEKLSTSRVAVSYRKSTAVELVDEAAAIEYLERSGHDDALKYTAPSVNKSAVASLLKSGTSVDGAALVERSNIQIK